MAAGDKMRASTQRARAMVDQKRARVSELRQKVESMRTEMDQLIQIANEWEREMVGLQQDFQEIERFAQEMDEFEKRMR